MLRITIPKIEMWDEAKREFIYTKEQTLQLEHSLVSLSRWESKWRKPFLSKDAKTEEEFTDYIRCMTLTQNVNPDVYRCIPSEMRQQIRDYIDEPMTATWFSKDEETKTSSRIITSELIYCWMINLQIPFDREKWHLNRLLTLIEVCNRENQPKKKMPTNKAMSQQAALNAARRKKLNTRG